MVVDSSAYALGAMRTPSSAFQDDLVNQEFAFVSVGILHRMPLRAN